MKYLILLLLVSCNTGDKIPLYDCEHYVDVIAGDTKMKAHCKPSSVYEKR